MTAEQAVAQSGRYADCWRIRWRSLPPHHCGGHRVHRLPPFGADLGSGQPRPPLHRLTVAGAAT